MVDWDSDRPSSHHGPTPHELRSKLVVVLIDPVRWLVDAYRVQQGPDQRTATARQAIDGVEPYSAWANVWSDCEW